LFLERTPSDTELPYEILELIRAVDFYDYKKLRLRGLPSDAKWPQISYDPEVETQLLHILQLKDYQILALQDHDLFKRLRGNPYSIALIACVRANPIEKRTLSMIYESIRSGQQQSLMPMGDNLNNN
jgi:hypothetical protein